MTRTQRVWVGFLVAPGMPAALLYVFGRLKGYGNAAVVGPLILALPAYISAMALGLPVHLILRKRGIASFGSYVGLGAVIGLLSVFALDAIQAIDGWSYTPDHAYSLSLWRYSGGYLRVAALYAGLASAAFWLIAVREQRKQERTLRDVA